MNATLVGKMMAKTMSNTDEISSHTRPSPLLVCIYKKSSSQWSVVLACVWKSHPLSTHLH